MSATPSDRLYTLLPAIYRQRDTDQGQPLRALLAVIEGELLALEGDIAGLYANWFIETCAEWVVPYIGDLLATGAATAAQTAHSQRALVANTVAYRRRKGVAAILERVAQDASGWAARAVESFALLGATQHVQHRRPGKGALVDVRAAAALAALGGPFEQVAHTVDARNAAPFVAAPDVLAARRGGFNLPIVRLFLWRLQSYALDAAAAGTPADAEPGRFTVHPFGQDQPLFNRPQPLVSLTDQAQPVNLPTPLTLPLLAADLQAFAARYGALPPEQHPPFSDFCGPGRALQIVKDGVLVPPTALIAADLGDWAAPPAGMVAVDPRTGRLAFASGEAPARSPVVSACYGFSADLGGGPYDRRSSLVNLEDADWAAIVASPDLPSAAAAPPGVQMFPTLGAALVDWAASGGKGVIQIADSGLYAETLAPLALPAGGALTIQAANGARPALRLGGDLTLQGGGAAASVTLNGLLLDGGIAMHGSLALTAAHCTLWPHGVTFADGDATALKVTITSSLVGPLLLPAETAALTVQDSIVDGSANGYAIAAGAADAPPGPPLTVSNATLFGRVVARELTASNTIFADPVLAQRRQVGNLRFCSLADGSATPLRFRCQPDLALGDLATQGLSGDSLPQAEERLRTRLRPVFTSRRFGDPAYAQLGATCAAEITGGADDGAAMGAFHDLQEPARAANLRARLDEYLRAGLDAGIEFVM